MNVRGAGSDYGECCVRFGEGLCLRSATCFAGDPIRVAFDSGGRRVLSTSDILRRFAPHEHALNLLVVHQSWALRRESAMDVDQLAQVLAARESMIEIHLHGRVDSAHAVEVAMRRSYFDGLRALCYDYEAASGVERKAKRFDGVRGFKRLLLLIDRHPTMRLITERY